MNPRRDRTPPLRLALFAVSGALVVSAAAAHAGEPTPGYPAIQHAFLREDFGAVTSLAQSFILEHPDVAEVPRVWVWLALSLDRLQQPQQALRELERLKARLRADDALWPEVMFWEGDVSRRARQFDRGRRAYAQLIKHDPASTWAAQARMGLGLIAFEQQAFRAALESFRALAEEERDSGLGGEATMLEGLCLLQLKEYQEAIRILAPLTADDRRPHAAAQAAVYLGESLSSLGRYEDARTAYRRAIEAAPGSSWERPAQFGLGWACYQTGQCEEGVGALAAYLAQPAPEYHTEALFAQASCLLRVGRDREAVSRFREVISLDPAHALALESALFLAQSYQRDGRLALAKELLQTFLRRSGGGEAGARIQVRLGAIALEEGHEAQARALFGAALERGDSATRQIALSGLADAELFVGRLREAEALYEDAIRVVPSSAQAAYARYQVGRIALQLGRFGRAIEEFTRLAEGAFPAIADEARLGLIVAAVNQGDAAAARDLLRAITEMDGRGVLAARARYYEALLALQDGEEARAEELCEEVVRRVPLTEEGLEARLLLADFRLRAASAREVMAWLHGAYASLRFPGRHRGRLAKRLGDLARGEGAYREAFAWYDEALKFLPSLRGELIYRIASCYEEAGDHEVAIEWYRRIDTLPWRVRGQLAAAKLLERGERNDEAETIYEQLMGEAVPEAELVRERLAALRAGPSRKESE